MLYFIRWHLPWLLMMVLIFWLSSQPDLPSPLPPFNFSDKLIHFIVFGILGWLTARGLSHCTKDGIRRHYFSIAVGLTIVFAASDEWHQSFVPGRYADVLDWVADALGIILFVYVYSRIRRT